jgi:uncharacterized protein YeaO (DUF488 family)
MFQTKSVHTEPRASDGWRILVTRFRGRGLAKDRYDVWMASLGPSERLLRAFQAGKISWPQFKKRYQAELFQSDKIDAQNPSIKNHGQKFTLRLLQELAQRGPVTLMCHCAEEEQQCHRHVLKAVLERKL